jgi:hypothetical protein
MRIRSLALALLVPASALLAACGGGEVTVRVMSSTEDGEASPVEDNVVTFVPYDRDSIFQVMSQQADQAEPQPSEELREQINQVIDARNSWRQAEQEWQELRDSLKTIRSQMEGLDRRSREYLELFDQFEQLEKRVNGLENRKDQQFARFDSLQQATVERQDSLRAVITSWEDDAFRGYVDVTDSILREKGAEIRRDTTGTDGYASVSLPAGDWWVFTRTAPGPYEELYWNLRIQAGQVDTLVLNRENAEVRLRL